VSGSGRVLVVDDVARNIRLLEALLTPEGYEVVAASSGADALARVADSAPDVILLDIRMPDLDGYEVCRRVRSDDRHAFLPIIMVTSAEGEERIKALDAGADDFVAKPLDQRELLARVRSLIRIKQAHDTIASQAAELADLNRDLAGRVETQVAEIERLDRLRRFLPAQLAEVALSSGGDALLASHRREIAVVFADLAGWTAFSETTEPEEVMGVIREFHETIGEIMARFEATVGWFAGDGVMAWFNDPFPVTDPAVRAATMAIAMRDAMATRTAAWRHRGHQLDFAVGVSLGYATIGTIGFDRRYEYGAVGSALNLASRLSDEAGPGQILMSARAFAAAEDRVEGDRVADLKLKGFAKPVMAFSVRRMKPRQRPSGERQPAAGSAAADAD
jgi:class 3 adenylate cyclase/CheY-like chemotaxis protein